MPRSLTRCLLALLLLKMKDKMAANAVPSK